MAQDTSTGGDTGHTSRMPATSHTIDLTRIPEAAGPAPARPTTVEGREPRRRPEGLRGDPTTIRGSFHRVLATGGIGMVLGAIIAAAVAIIMLLVSPTLADFGFGASAVFVVMSAGFGLVPGLLVGVLRAEDELDPLHMHH